MHNYVRERIIEDESLVLTCLHSGLFLRKLFTALAFVCIVLQLYKGVTR
jgi:hypothetical protein